MLLQGRTAVTQKQSDERKNPVPILYLFNINMPEQNQGTIVELSLDFEKQTVISTRFHKFFDFSFLSQALSSSRPNFQLKGLAY